MTVVARTANSTAPLLRGLREAILEIDPIQPPQAVLEVNELVANDIAAERFYATLLGVFATVALALAAAGLYGLLSYWVGLRRRELGVRIALGASAANIIALVLSEGMVAVGLGIAAGLAAAIASTRLLASMLFGVQPLDALTFVAVSGVLTLVALLSCLRPALRATRLDPMHVIREQ
jgi:ABC-type antimicrobial peptide transport system permease subunit